MKEGCFLKVFLNNPRSLGLIGNDESIACFELKDGMGKVKLGFIGNVLNVNNICILHRVQLTLDIEIQRQNFQMIQPKIPNMNQKQERYP